MLQNFQTFSSFSVTDIEATKNFYHEVLGIEVEQTTMGLELKLKNDSNVFIYEKADHQPATFTVLNFIVENINGAVDELVKSGVIFEQYQNMPASQDQRGILRGLAENQGPDIAWFKDPSGNILSLLQVA